MPFTHFNATSPLADGKMMQTLLRFTIRKTSDALWWRLRVSRPALSFGIRATHRAFDL